MTASTEHIWSFLDQVPDPEIPAISIVDLGIIRDVAWQNDRLEITIPRPIRDAQPPQSLDSKLKKQRTQMALKTLT